MRTRPGLPLRHHPLVWDLAIALLALAGAGGTILGTILVRQAPHDVWWVLPIVSALALVLLIYGSFVEPKRITLNKKIVRIKGLPPLTIAVAADLHVGPYKGKAFVARAVARLNALGADLIVLPGDFLFDSTSDTRDLEPLQQLHAPLGVFAVIGNHDSGQHILDGKHYETGDRTADVQRMLEQCGITVLRNQSVRLTHAGAAFALAGIDDLWMPSVDLPRALLSVPACLPLILLSHNPDVVLHPAAARAQLIVSGHTHGGQVRIPGYGAVATIPSDTGTHYDRGIFTLRSGATLAVTHGIGETLCRARLFCPPEILLLQTTSA